MISLSMGGLIRRFMGVSDLHDLFHELFDCMGVYFLGIWDLTVSCTTPASLIPTYLAPSYSSSLLAFFTLYKYYNIPTDDQPQTAPRTTPSGGPPTLHPRISSGQAASARTSSSPTCPRPASASAISTRWHFPNATRPPLFSFKSPSPDNPALNSTTASS